MSKTLDRITDTLKIGGSFALVGVIVLLVVGILSYSFGIYTPTGHFVKKEKAIHALEDMGFTEVTVEKRQCWFIDWRGGGSKDVVRFILVGKNPAGNTVTMHVYSGWPFKAATVRSPE